MSEAVDAARPRATDKGVELWLDVDRVPVTAADAGRLGQAVDNLISNAIKFTDTGGRVVVTLTREGDRAAIRVSDTGMGIARGDKAKLFERFFRSANAVEQAVPGVGLGLTIAKAIVDGHHGMIDVDSEEGNGTTFTIRLPLASPETGSAALPSSTEVRG